MADSNSSLPIRTENNGDVVARIGDGLIPGQMLEIDSAGRITTKNQDGAGNALTSTAGALDVNVTNSVAVTATDLDIRPLTSADTVTVVATALDVRPMSSATDSMAVVATDLDIRNLNSATDSVAVTGSVTVSATNLDIRNLSSTQDSVTVLATDLDIRDLTAADVVSVNLRDASGAAFSAMNPLAVTIAADGAGTEVNDYNTAAVVAALASSNHDYTVTALKTLLLTQIEASASGKMKIEVQVETAAASGVFNTKFVQFNSTANTNMSIQLKAPIAVPAGAKVRIIRTNLDKAGMDLYSTISGQEI